MSILAKRSIVKEDKSNIITLGAIAKEMKKSDPEIVNATIGMLYDEEGKLLSFKSVDKVLSSLTTDEKYAYGSTPGSKEYHEALKRWIFRDYYDEFKDISSVMATPGGTGALSNTIGNYLNDGDKVLVPSYMWGNYKQIAYENHVDFMTYNLFNKDGNLDLEDIKNKMHLCKEAQGRVLIIINDPCQNPTGYIMKDNEWEELINIIQDISSDNTPVVLLHDMAYIDYDHRGFEATRKNIYRYKDLNPSVLCVMAFSGSKTMALYGIRIGAQVCVSSNPENLFDFDRANKFSSRSKWSNSTQLGMSIISKVVLNDEYRKSFEEELEESRALLAKRAKTFIEESNKVGLKTLPFECGFFITIPCDNATKAYEYLVNKKIHIIPMGNVLRVTLAAISVKECKMLPKFIKEALDNI